MLDWWKPRTQLEKLEHHYAELMKKSFKVALRDKKRSDALCKEAEAILDKINRLKFKNGGGTPVAE